MPLPRKLVRLAELGVRTAQAALDILRGGEPKTGPDERGPSSDFLDRAWGFSPERPERGPGPA